MKKIRFLFIITALFIAFTSCEEENDPETSIVEVNPLIGSWKDPAYPNNSYLLVTFEKNMDFQMFQYDGSDGTSETVEGTYDYSEKNETLTFKEDGGEVVATTYKKVNPTTLVIGDYTYFKQ